MPPFAAAYQVMAALFRMPPMSKKSPERRVAHRIIDRPPSRAGTGHHDPLQFAVGLQPRHPCGPFVAGRFQIDAPLEHGVVHGEIVTAEMADEEMNDKDMAHGQDRLDPVDPEGHI
jgi:hypothetical protein